MGKWESEKSILENFIHEILDTKELSVSTNTGALKQLFPADG